MTEAETVLNGEILPPEPSFVGEAIEARQIVGEYAMWSMVAGMVPLAAVDLALIAGVQLRMLERLSAYYRVPFAQNAARAAVAALLGSLGPGALKYSVVGQTLKSIPLVGPLLGMMTVPGFAMAFTYAIGRVFIEHFESGGTFLTFRPQAARDRFRSEFDAARSRRPS